MRKTDEQIMAAVGITDFSLIDNIVLDNNGTRALCDMYIQSADYDGVPMTYEQLDAFSATSCLQEELIHECLH
jgi:hypothetical protein